jgi:hypothetical protein
MRPFQLKSPPRATVLETLQKSENFIVLPSDKRLGHCIIKFTKYIQTTLHHLADAATYKRFKPNDAI